MIQLSLDYAHRYLLQVLDELKNVEESPMIVSDELDTRKLAEGFLVEAVLKSHKDAPSHLVDGVVGTAGTDYSATIDDDGVATIVMSQESARLASLKASDSSVVVVDYAPEESPIGRMQNNPYVRGTYDDPRLIVKKVWSEERKPEYVYYSVKDKSVTFVLEYVPYPSGEGEVQISDKLEYAVLTLLVAMVLNAISEHEKATLYKTRYQEYLQTSR